MFAAKVFWPSSFVCLSIPSRLHGPTNLPHKLWNTAKTKPTNKHKRHNFRWKCVRCTLYYDDSIEQSLTALWHVDRFVRIPMYVVLNRISFRTMFYEQVETHLIRCWLVGCIQCIVLNVANKNSIRSHTNTKSHVHKKAQTRTSQNIIRIVSYTSCVCCGVPSGLCQYAGAQRYSSARAANAGASLRVCNCAHQFVLCFVCG